MSWRKNGQEWPTLSRITDFEDRFLDKEVYAKKTKGFCGILPCTSNRDKRFIPDQEKQDFIATLQTIQQLNEPIRQSIALITNNKKTSSSTLALTKLGFFKQLLVGVALINLQIEPTMKHKPSEFGNRHR